MSLFLCNGCSEQIPALKARIHCQSCPKYDSCANCYVVGLYVGNHNEAHDTELVTESGYVKLPEPRPPPKPPRPARTETARESPPSRKAVPQVPSQPSQQSSDRSSQQPSANEPRWRPLFDGTLPSPILTGFLMAIFNCLDTGGTGYLSPEQYSGFLDVCGYTVNENVWKKAMAQPTFGYNREDKADFELTMSYQNFSIDHIMQKRNLPPNTQMADLTSSFAGAWNRGVASMINQAMTLPPLSGGLKPMLSCKGFIDITALEVLYEPGAGWNYLNRMFRRYGVWQERGEIPRNMLPTQPPQELLDMVKAVNENSQRRAKEMLDAKQAEYSLRAQGRQNALDLIDDRRYYR